MALRALAFHQNPFSYVHKDFRMPLSCGFGFEEEDQAYGRQTPFESTHLPNVHMLKGNMSSNSLPQSVDHQWDIQKSSSPENRPDDRDQVVPPATTVCGRIKRRKTKRMKNEEEVENQRSNHIEVERNRRKLMSDYLAMLRSLMPPSYLQRADQASIVGGAVNFVKELEQLLHALRAQKQDTNVKQSEAFFNHSSPFSDFFILPQYCMNPAQYNNVGFPGSTVENGPAIANVEVTMVENHAHIKVLSTKYAKQLLKIVVGIESLGFNVQHLNVTTAGHMALYSFSVRVEEKCQLTSVNEIAAAVYEMVCKIQEEAKLKK